MHRLFILLAFGLLLNSCSLIFKNWDAGEDFVKDEKNFNINNLKKNDKAVIMIRLHMPFTIQNLNNDVYTTSDNDRIDFAGFDFYILPPGHYFISNGILTDPEVGSPPLAKSLFTVGAATLTKVYTWYDLMKIPGVYHFEVKAGDVKYFGSVGADVVRDSERVYAWTGLVVNDEFDKLQKSLTRYSKKYDKFKNTITQDHMKLSPLPPRCLFYKMVEGRLEDKRYRKVYEKTPENIQTCLNDLKELFEREK